MSFARVSKRVGQSARLQNWLQPLAQGLLCPGVKLTSYRELHYKLQDGGSLYEHELPMPQRVAVVGAGMSGMSTALALQAEGHTVRVFLQKALVSY